MYLLKFFLFFYIPAAYCKQDYYELLGIPKAATNQEIRRAFKKLAVSLHPDKNQDDPEAHEKFIKITRAYEILKDADKRKHYDLHGEDTTQSQYKPQYHSYAYYRDHFGIYDDDPHIVTLTQSDFETNVEDSDSQWFVNFYSPMCQFCHTLAPTWRSLAEEFNGAIYFGAVNCEEDWGLCRSKGVNSYPTLMMYPSNEEMRGADREFLHTFIMDRLRSDIVSVSTKETWDKKKETHSNWLLLLNYGSEIPKSFKIIGAMLRGLLGVASINCQMMPCDDWDKENGDLIYMTKRKNDIWASTYLKSESPRDVFNEVLGLLPALKKVDDNMFQDILEDLQDGSSTPWLIYFHMGVESNLDAEVKKLTALLTGFEIGRVNCGQYTDLCQGLSISRYPTFGVFKTGGGWEFYHGSETAQAIAGFARESAAAINLRTIGEAEFSSELRRGGPMFVDFYAPWCPPCLRLLPQLRKASLSFSPDQIAFATVDCTIHRDLCAGQGVQAYPTTLLFNATRRPQSFRGQSATSIIEFLDDILHPQVIELNYDTFYETVGKKKKGTIWMVGYFMPWCGPCQQLAPHYRKLAKIVSELSYVKIAEVNCEVEATLCQERGVKSYPHIQLHSINSQGLSSVEVFSGFQRDAQSLRRWLYKFVPSPVVDLTPYAFSQITSETSSWLVDFFAPWCGHCISFEPDFIDIANKLEGRVKTGKLNCENYPQVCQKAGVHGYPTVKFYSPNHVNGIEIHSQKPSVIIESVENLLQRKPRFADEL